MALHSDFRSIDGEEVHAVTRTQAGSLIRSTGYEDDERGWLAVVDIVSPDGDVTPIYKGKNGLQACGIYNHTIEPYVDDDGDEVHR